MSDVEAQAGHDADLEKLGETAAWSGAQPVSDEKVALSELEWFPSGPVARAFVLDPAPVTLICGPWGSGKTTALFVKLLLCACAVPPSPIDGVRYARVAVVRDTYRNLESNTIPSWQERLPKDLGKWKGGGGGEPGAHVIDFILEDGTTLHLEALFVAVGDHNVKQFCDGLQVTACAMNGLDELPEDLIGYMLPRLGRWPPPQHRPANWKMFVDYWCKIMADMNAPEEDNFTVRDFSESPKEGYKLFLQPSGFSPEAENLENLREGYYQKLAAANEPWWVKRFIENRFGYSRKGKPVYPEFDRDIHVSRVPLKYDPKRKLVFGLDAQKDACAVAQQREFSGRLVWLRSFVPPLRMGAKQFGKWLADEVAIAFPDLREYEFSLDPSGFDPNGIDDDFTWAEVFGRAFGLGEEWSAFVLPAPTNNLDPRVEVVRTALSEVGGFLLCPVGCKDLIRPFMTGYRYGDTTTHGDGVLTQIPIKNEWSHRMEAGQYGALRLSGMRNTIGRPAKRRPQPAEIVHDPLG